MILGNTSPSIIFPRGDTYVADFTVRKADNTLADLTGCSIFFTVKAQYSNPDSLKLFQKAIGSGIVVSSPTSGVFRLTIAPADTQNLEPYANYVWDVQIKQADASINTPDGLSGVFVVTPDVYNAIT